MRTLGFDHTVRFLGAGRVRRSAFTLVELIVALGVLSFMLVLAGEVMNLTVKSTGQATAVTTTSRELRDLERMLREDLGHVARDKSLMVIVGNPVGAYWTALGQQSDDDGDNDAEHTF